MISLHDLAPAPSLDLSPEDDIVALRRDFHAHPEIGFHETRTARIVAERLRALDIEVHENIGVTGVVGILRGGREGKTVLVRADMDALPIIEENDWAWKSTAPGAMHACGHDAHTATGLTVARLLAAEKENLSGNVVFMFQPAEEGLGGAMRMIDDGLLEILKPDFCLGLHVWSEVEAGKVAISDGPVMASTDDFRCTIRGKGGHGALPHQTVDPVVIAAHLVTALQSIVSRSISPTAAGVVTVGKLQAGTAFNIIPDTAFLEGTVRAFEEPVRATLEKRLRELCETLPQAWGATAELAYTRGYPATVNTPEICDVVRGAAAKVVGQKNVIPFEPTTGAEDFSQILQRVPGCFFFVGARNPEVGAIWPHHHPKFNICETSLMIGARTLVESVKACLAK